MKDAERRKPVSVVVHAKHASRAKTRLGLPPEESRCTALRLAAATVRTALTSSSAGRVVVVTSDAAVAEYAAVAGAGVVPERRPLGMHRAAVLGRRPALTVEPNSPVAVLVADLPHLQCAELDEVISQFHERGVPLFVRDRHGRVEVGTRAEEAWAVGATEICMQGGIHPELPGTAYFELAREIKRRVPDIHLHAYSPMEILNGAARTGLSYREFLIAAKEAGGDSIPGTAAEILDDDVRWVLTKGKLPADAWIEMVSAAHEIRLPASSTIKYGHVNEPRHWLGHLRTLAGIQDRTGGFTEFVGLPFVHQSSPIYLAGKARAGATEQENRAVHAMARILLRGRIDNIQTSWVKLGDDGTRLMVTGGANDLGGTLMEETISRMAGAQNGSLKTVEPLRTLAEPLGRPARQRSTTYGEVSDERLLASAQFDDAMRHQLDLAPVND